MKYVKKYSYLFPISLVALLAIRFAALPIMEQHPDSMISSGLRWLSTGPIEFNQYNTYGPFAFAIYGLLSGVIFLIGLLFGFWHNTNEFELAFRANYIEGIGITFNRLYLIVNLCILFLIAYLLYKIFSQQKKTQSRKILDVIPLQALSFLILLAIPIIVYQFSLETIEPLVLLGVIFFLYNSKNILTSSDISKNQYVFLPLSFLLTIGIRPSQIILVSIVSLHILWEKRYQNFPKTIYVYSLSLIVVVISYLPVLNERERTENFLRMSSRLAKLEFDRVTMMNNLNIILLNVGPIGSFFILLMLVVFLAPSESKKRFEIINNLSIVVYLILYLLNANGFPKYLITPVGILLANTAYFMNSERALRLRKKRSLVISLASLTVVSTLSITNTFASVERMEFDTRSEMKAILNEIPKWKETIHTSEIVIAEMTRGKKPVKYEDIIQEVNLIDKVPNCAKSFLLSSATFDVSMLHKIIKKCKKIDSPSNVYMISPYKIAPTNSFNENSALISLGNQVDKFRRGYGPMYILFLTTSDELQLGENFLDQICHRFLSCKRLG